MFCIFIRVYCVFFFFSFFIFFFLQAEDGIRDLVRSRGLGDVYKRQVVISAGFAELGPEGLLEQERLRDLARRSGMRMVGPNCMGILNTCLLYTSDAADERSSVDLGGRRIIKKKKNSNTV